MKYTVVQTKVGWIVQNIDTYVVVAGPYTSREQALGVVKKLSGGN